MVNEIVELVNYALTLFFQVINSLIDSFIFVMILFVAIAFLIVVIKYIVRKTDITRT